MKRVLIFAPYAGFSVHAQVDGVFGAALQQRGAQVRLVICDGVFGDCALFRGAAPARQREICASCARHGQDLASTFGLDAIQLRALIQPEDRAAARVWVEGLAPAGYLEAAYEGRPVGEWVSSTVLTYFRVARTEIDRPDVLALYKQYLHDAVLVFRAVGRLLDESRPDLVFMLSGRFAPHRTVMEAAHERGIDVVNHERGHVPDSFTFHDNEDALTYRTGTALAASWADVSMSPDELEQTRQYFVGRELGKGMNWHGFYAEPSAHADVRRQLRLEREAPVVSFFTSSEDEILPSRESAAIGNQLDYVGRLIELYRHRPEYLVVRQHPYIAGDRYSPAVLGYLQRAHQQAIRLPSNVRMVMPGEPLTSYALGWHSDVALAFYSTISVELAARGVATYAHPQSMYIQAVRGPLPPAEPAAMNAFLDRALAAPAAQPADLRRCFRTIYSLFFRFARRFAAFGIKDHYYADLRLQGLDDLRPGRDPELDAICDRLLGQGPLGRLPGAAERARPAEVEERFFVEELARLESHRASVRAAGQIRYREHRTDQVTVFVLQGPASWLRISRHRELAVVPLALDLDGLTEGLARALRESESPLVMLGHEGVSCDESMVSWALDVLAAEPLTQAVTFGFWIARGPDHTLVGEARTARRPTTVEELRVAFAFAPHPALLLATGVFRRDKALALLEAAAIPDSTAAWQSAVACLTAGDVQHREAAMLVVADRDEPVIPPQELPLRLARLETASLLLGASPEVAPRLWAQAARMYDGLTQGGLKRRPLTRQERQVADAASEALRAAPPGPAAAPLLVAAMLFRFPAALGEQWPPEQVPESLRPLYQRFLAERSA